MRGSSRASLFMLSKSPADVNADAQKPLSGKSGLVIDDLAASVVLGKNILNSLGASRVDTAATYQEAMSFLTHKKYTFVLCDFNLGKSLTGQQILRDARHEGKLSHSTLFVMVSAERTKEIVLGTIECEPDGYVTKPYTLRSLEIRLRALLEQQRVLESFNAYRDHGDHEKALQAINSVISSNTKHRSFAFRRKGRYLFEMGRFEEALAVFEEVNQARAQHWAITGVAKCKLELGMLEEAESQFKEILEDYPLFVSAWDGLVETQRRMGKRGEAFDTLKQAISISPMSIDRQLLVAELSLTLGDLYAAVRANRSMIEMVEGSHKEEPSYFNSYGYAMRRLIEASDENEAQIFLEECQRLFKLAARKFPDNREIKFNQAQIVALKKLKNGGEAEAIAEWQKVLTRYRDLIEEKPYLAIDLAEAFIAAGDSENAGNMLDHALKSDRISQDDKAKAQSIKDAPISLHKHAFFAEWNRQGRGHYKKGEFTKALECFKEALQQLPTHPVVNLNAAQALLQLIQQGDRSKKSIWEVRQYLQNAARLPKGHSEYRRQQFLEKAVAQEMAT